MSRLIYSLYRLALLTDRYSKCFGPVRGPALLLVSLAFPPARGWTVRPKGSRIPLAVRIGSSDVEVYCKVFISYQYLIDLGDEPKSIVDAGAYTGLSTAWFATTYPNATVVAVEPNTENFKLLQRNTSGLANVHAIHAALWHEETQLQLVDPGRGAWGFQVAPSSDRASGRRVQGVTVDGITRSQGLDAVSLLKIDIEGAEKEVLEHSDAWMPSVQAVVAELHDDLCPGCSRAFYAATRDFPVESRQGENVFVRRGPG